MRPHARKSLAAIAAAGLLALAATPATAAPRSARYDWPQFAFDESKSADNTKETTVGAGNVATLGRLFTTPITDVPDGAPLLLSGVTTATGVRDLVFIQGEHGHLNAYDGHTGTQVWSTSFGPTTGSSNTGPAIDPDRQFIYVNGNDGNVHKVRVADGTEVTGGGWPELAGPGKASSELTIATDSTGASHLYASNEGHGHITTIDLATGKQHVFSFSCANRPDIHFGAPGAPNDCTVNGPEPWSRGPSYDPSLNLLFQMGGTNNGTTWVPGKVWRQSWVALPPDGSTTLRGGGGYPVDSYTPTNWAATVKSDQDIGAGGLLILPVGLSKKYPHLGVQPGKDHKIRLLNLADLSGKGGPGNLGGELQLFDFPQMGLMRSQGAVWTDPRSGAVWVLVPGGNGIAGFQIAVDTAGVPSLRLKWFNATSWTTSAFVANGVLYAANGGGEHTDKLTKHQVQAIDPTTGKVLWAGDIGQHHWSSPILANGTLYMVDGNSGGFGTGTAGNLIAWSPGGK
ncbi:PQQ-binding-like beta-propeller repeat protein [Kutzneria buriramensis]|uniref:Putative pyrroloquinoline-quinone binding quinoprotein n=1 Tax=Kutzneria buriramensis TaxID=1045776 RepID=A0A3E0GYC8_9PSEU|nr:PQQ-binding-like beta-propeller repeat protein [Kutzneria buriramensis]REH34929.1 putative pyrroloquinoline-quinone binding quinoprotein [Kutzneria buriramensis]